MKTVAILAYNWEDFAYYISTYLADTNKVADREGVKIVSRPTQSEVVLSNGYSLRYISRPQSFRGYRFDDFYVTERFWKRNDATEIYDEVKYAFPSKKENV